MLWIAAAIGLLTATAGVVGAGEQKSVDERQTELRYQDNLEKIRRRKFEQEQTKGTARAFSEASGVLHTGGSTAQGVLNTMAREFRLELDWMQRFATEARRIGHQRASVAHQINVLQAFSGGIQTGASIYGAASAAGTT